MRIRVTDVRVEPWVETTLGFAGSDDMVLHEWENRVWPLLVSVEETLFEVALLDDDGELIEVGGLDVRGYTLLNETPPSVVEHPIGFEL